MKLSELLYETTMSPEGDDIWVEGMSCDSRTVQDKGLFIALSPEPETRQKHICQALSKGATVLCVPEGDTVTGAVALYSKNPRHDYGMMAGNWFHRPAHQLSIVGVTGTNGKTTTTHIIKSMLEQLADGTQRKVGLIGTNENKIGEKTLPSHRTTPDAMELHGLLRQMVEEGCHYAVMEVSSHGLVQERTAGIPFSVGVFTNLTQDHLDYHDSMEDYEKAKEKIFPQSDCAVVNLDDDTGRRFRDHCLREGIPCYTYAEKEESATLHAEKISLTPRYITFDCCQNQRKVPVYLPIPGGFSLYNALASLACGVALQLPLLKLAETFPAITGVKGRIEVLPTPSEYTVLIDYAHTPDALENILLTARNITQGNLICLFGCGGNRDRSKRAIMGEIAESFADFIVVTSDNPRFEEPEDIIADILKGMESIPAPHIHVEPNRQKGIFHALSMAKTGDVVVLAGKGHECYQEICGTQYHMDEREIVQSYFQELCC